MYLEYWGFNIMPFNNAPDPRFFFESEGHKEAVTRLLFAIQSKKAFTLLTGDYGSGKTVVCETVISQLPQEKFKVAFITNPRLDALDLSREIAYKLGEEVAARSMYDTLHVVNNLLERHAATGKHCVVMIDEAQLILNTNVLEDIRLLLNHHRAGGFLLTLVLVGQTEFGDMLKSIPQMVQRIALKYHIKNLQPAELQPYILSRIKLAGGRDNLFDQTAFDEIARYSKCNPREINAICDLALLIGCLTEARQITAKEVSEAINERQ
ncbi:MAG: ExeA family protein [Kiritimatiellia bacterium]|jgi:general secretion pathway protein A